MLGRDVNVRGGGGCRRRSGVEPGQPRRVPLQLRFYNSGSVWRLRCDNGRQMLTPELLEQLDSAAGQQLLRRAEELLDDPFAAQKLRSGTTPELAAAAVEQTLLRQRARAKFARAHEMWFTGPLLEQASGEVISRFRARRFAGQERVADLCCGLGGDSISLAAVVDLIAVDRDPLALELTTRNGRVHGVQVETRAADLPEGAPNAWAAWIDPGRREGGKRVRSVDAISPTLVEVLSLPPRIRNLGIKLSPGTPDRDLDDALAGIPHERQLISVSGECRELVVWLGDLASAPRTASVLPTGAELTGDPLPLGESAPTGGYLLEPDPAVIRSGLVGNLARELDAWPIDPRLAYLSSDRPVQTPFATLFRIEKAEPFSGKALAQLLRVRGAADVVLKTRGFAAEPEALRRQLRPVLKQGKPGIAPVVFLTRLNGRAVMILGERLGAGRDNG
jgi:hypothetical protein